MSIALMPRLGVATQEGDCHKLPPTAIGGFATTGLPVVILATGRFVTLTAAVAPFATRIALGRSFHGLPIASCAAAAARSR